MKYNILLFFFGFLSSLNAQDFPGSRDQSQAPLDTLNTGLSLEEATGPDTTILNYYYLSDLTELHTFRDTSLTYFEDYHPFKNFEKFYLTLGSPNSSHMNAIWDGGNSVFTNLRFDQYQAFSLRPNKFRFFELNRPYNDLSFIPLGDQNEFQVSAKFSRDFDESINVSIDYLRITNDGEYVLQEGKNTMFSIGFWAKRPNSPHQMLISFYANNHNEQFNGGVSDTSFFNTELPIRTNVPVYLSGVDARNQDFEVALDNYFGDPSKWNAYHQVSYRSGYFRYSDQTTRTSLDSVFYEDFLIDERGLRNFQKYKTLKNTVLLGRGGDHIFNIKAGLTHQLQLFDFEYDQPSVNDLSLDGSLGFNISNIYLKADAKLGLLNIAGNFLINAEAGFRSSKWFEVDAGLKLLRNDPLNQDQHLGLNGALFWENSLNKKFLTEIYGRLYVPKTKTTLSITSLLIDNAIYYDTLANPLQVDESITGLQLMGRQKLGWKWIQTEHIIHYQVFSENLWNLPELMSKHKLFFKFKLFQNNLHFNVGGTFSQFLQDKSIAFQPVTGTFHPVESASPNFQNLDLFLTAKISNFRILFSWDNAIDFVSPNINYHIHTVPQWDNLFRFGVRWIIWD